MAECVATLLEKTVDELWPGLYPENYVVSGEENQSNESAW
jgi:hypothetical protein